jgi:hypothetical protein
MAVLRDLGEVSAVIPTPDPGTAGELGGERTGQPANAHLPRYRRPWRREAMTTASRYATLAGVLRDDEPVLHRAWIAHKTVHQPWCGEDCEARQVPEDARDRIRELLARER